MAESMIVDGNVLAGMLTELFESDPTTLEGVCGGCGARALLAETLVEVDQTSAIVRCRACTHTLATVLRDPTGSRLIIAGLRELRRR